jgi:hypothetical protein
MNVRKLALISLFLAVGMISAGSEECFSDKSLEELKAMYNVQVTQMPEHRKIEILTNRLSEKEAEYLKAQASCNKCTIDETPLRWNFAWGLCSFDDCRRALHYKDQILKDKKLLQYANEQMDNAMTSELQALKMCIVQREYDSI